MNELDADGLMLMAQLRDAMEDAVCSIENEAQILQKVRARAELKSDLKAAGALMLGGTAVEAAGIALIQSGLSYAEEIAYANLLCIAGAVGLIGSAVASGAAFISYVRNRRV